MRTPTVSVVIPVFNNAGFVAEAIDSALRQTFSSLEVIVVDDGSTDRTPAILAGFGSRIRLIRQPNRGIAVARNAALAVAGGRYIALLDSDDVWEPNHVERCVARLAAADSQTVGALTGSIHIDGRGREIPMTAWTPAARIGLRDLLPTNALRVSTTMIRHDAMRAVGGFDESLPCVEDWDLWLRLTISGGVFVAVDDARCRIRWHGGNLSRDPVLLRDLSVHTLEKLCANPTLPADLREQRDVFIAAVIAHTSWHLYGLGRDAEAAEDLRRAAGVWPEILCDEDTLHAIVCAPPPMPVGAGAPDVDLEQGAARVMHALRVACADATIDANVSGRAHARAARVLAHYAIRQARTGAARRFLWQALRHDPTLWSDPRTLTLLAQAVAGRQAVRAWQRLRPQ